MQWVLSVRGGGLQQAPTLIAFDVPLLNLLTLRLQPFLTHITMIMMMTTTGADDRILQEGIEFCETFPRIAR